MVSTALAEEAPDHESRELTIFRKGSQLVMHRQAILPDRCIKSNQPAQGLRLRRRLTWIHPLIYLTLPLGVIPFIILTTVFFKEATIDVGLSRPWFRKRRQIIFISWMTALLGLTIAISQATRMGWGLLLGVIIFLGGAIYGALAAKMVTPVRITSEYIWLKGVHSDYLGDLPIWPNRP